MKYGIIFPSFGTSDDKPNFFGKKNYFSQSGTRTCHYLEIFHEKIIRRKGFWVADFENLIRFKPRFEYQNLNLNPTVVKFDFF